MTHRQAKPPNTQRRFYSGWGELDYVCDKVRYWLYQRKQKAKAGRYSARLARILRALPANDVAIIREEGLALLYELQGKLDDAIIHREREIQLTERLHIEAQKHDPQTRTYMLRGRGMIDLQGRRAILAALKNEETRNHVPNKRKRKRGIDSPAFPVAT